MLIDKKEVILKKRKLCQTDEQDIIKIIEEISSECEDKEF